MTKQYKNSQFQRKKREKQYIAIFNPSFHYGFKKKKNALFM